MTLEANFNTVASVAGLSITTDLTATGNHQDGAQFSPSTTPATTAGIASTIVLRVGAADAVIDAGEDHGITTDDKVAVYFEGGYRYGMDVDSVDGTDITVSGGAGDNFPEAAGSGPHDIECTIAPRTRYSVHFDPTDIALIAAGANFAALLVFADAGGDALPIRMAANGGWSWHATSGAANPFTEASVGLVTTADVYAAGTTAPTVLYGALLNA